MLVLRIVNEYPEELEADFLEFFGVDLLDLWRGSLSLRRVGVLIKSLMTKHGRSTLLQSMDERASWAESDYLLARISDAMELSNFIAIKANAEGVDDLAFPSPIPRPGEQEPEDTEPETSHFASADELADFFGGMNSL
ncbi:hypothetical protein OG897_08470 [Streptomyces sp. NBC_00237]|uniref:hypothetical protein n=1 Tax=Streptomyces sp. NBC_00237 TaxID=2975687 RepID=UPI002254ED21|nr:hypothetical protein [Streptomyces sp. NBC_00237]MCX5201485.1 hypothetical protein [Streptomyces sp. NBC_00237]